TWPQPVNEDAKTVSVARFFINPLEQNLHLSTSGFQPRNRKSCPLISGAALHFNEVYRRKPLPFRSIVLTLLGREMEPGKELIERDG
ncbi:MAG: hypothetical protein WAN28_18260, partial [Terracidiphilus sp.]